MFPSITEVTGTFHHAQPLVGMWFCELFARAGLKPLSASQEAKIIGTNHPYLVQLASDFKQCFYIIK
jgi:hypothetical protein